MCRAVYRRAPPRRAPPRTVAARARRGRQGPDRTRAVPAGVASPVALPPPVVGRVLHAQARAGAVDHVGLGPAAGLCGAASRARGRAARTAPLGDGAGSRTAALAGSVGVRGGTWLVTRMLALVLDHRYALNTATAARLVAGAADVGEPVRLTLAGSAAPLAGAARLLGTTSACMLVCWPAVGRVEACRPRTSPAARPARRFAQRGPWHRRHARPSRPAPERAAPPRGAPRRCVPAAARRAWNAAMFPGFTCGRL